MNPWKVLLGTPDLTLVRAPMSDHGRYYDAHRAIVLDPRLTSAEARSTLMHELVHAERRDRPCADAVLDARQERIVHLEAARRLIPLEDLADALMWACDDYDLADQLWVDVATVRARREGLTPREHDLIERRIAAKEAGA